MKAVMNAIHRLFPIGHFVISLLFLAAGFALVGIAGSQLWQGVQLFDELAITERLNFVLESIAVLTVAVAALELGQTILEEEVQRAAHMSAANRGRCHIGGEDSLDPRAMTRAAARTNSRVVSRWRICS